MYCSTTRTHIKLYCNIQYEDVFAKRAKWKFDVRIGFALFFLLILFQNKRHTITNLDHARQQVQNPFPYDLGDTSLPHTRKSKDRQIYLLLRNSRSKVSDSYSAAEYTMDVSVLKLLTSNSISFLKAAEDKITGAEGYEIFSFNDVENNKGCNWNTLKCSLLFSITSHPLFYGKYDRKGNLCGIKTR